MWVTNYFTNNLYQIRASDMATVAIYATVVNPNPIVFDVANLRVASETSGELAKVRASDGVELNRLTLPATSHWGMAFDGESVWLSNTNAGSITKVRASDAQIVGAYPAGNQPRGMAFDGNAFWVVNNGDNSVAKFNSSTGALIGNDTVGTGPIGVAFDGANLWTADSYSNAVSKHQEGIDAVTVQGVACITSS